MGSAEIEELLVGFFEAIEAGDRESIARHYADDIEIWHSATGRTVDKKGGLAILNWLLAPGVVLRYEVQEQLVVGDRVSRRHVLHVDVPGHPTLSMPVSIYLTVTDGVITRIDEYVDAHGTDTLIAIVPSQTA